MSTYVKLDGVVRMTELLSTLVHFPPRLSSNYLLTLNVLIKYIEINIYMTFLANEHVKMKNHPFSASYILFKFKQHGNYIMYFHNYL